MGTAYQANCLESGTKPNVASDVALESKFYFGALVESTLETMACRRRRQATLQCCAEVVSLP